jgi:large subunit ribosomal protein L35Ae
MEGKIINFRRGRNTVKEKHYLIDVGAKNRKDAEKYVGKIVEWKSLGAKPKTIVGKITGAHGNNGMVRAIFEKGLPGQSITTKVEVKEK